MEIITKSVEETIQAGYEFAAKLPRECAAVLFYGGMGAGKTHFVKGMAQALGVVETVTSPTYALANFYESGQLLHVDLFRIGSMDELFAAGIMDYFADYSGDVIGAFEWAENIPPNEWEEEFGGAYCTVKIDKTGDDERVITIDYTGD